ncbi:MAG: universal stress protein [Haloarculaceae archaeon]
MFDRLLCATDGSDAAGVALDHAIDLAAASDATLEVLSVVDADRDVVTRVGGDVVDGLRAEAESIVEAAARRARERDVDVETTVGRGDPAETIVAAADENGADLLVLATHGRTTLERFLVGSVADDVLRTASVPVLSVPAVDEAPRYPYRAILVPTDGSDPATAALDRSIDLAGDVDATLHVLSVVDPEVLGWDVRSADTDRLEDHADSVLADARERADAAGLADVVTERRTGAIYRTITDYATEAGIDLVAMGTHGRTGLDRVVLGSVAEKCVRTVPVPVLTVRG